MIAYMLEDLSSVGMVTVTTAKLQSGTEGHWVRFKGRSYVQGTQGTCEAQAWSQHLTTAVAKVWKRARELGYVHQR